MKQYCRYYVNLCVNEVPYCDAYKEFRSESSCKRPNNCKEFIFANVEPEYQDAFGETHGYKERTLRKIVCDGQMTLFDMGDM